MARDIAAPAVRGETLPSPRMRLDTRDTGFLKRLRAAGPPRYEVFGAHRSSPRARELATAGEFVVFDAIAEPVRLTPPVDWTQDPFESRSWCAQLHTLRFLGVPLSAYHQTGDRQALGQACELVLDWAAQNTIGTENASPFAWLDKIVGDRAPFIGYVLRAGLHADLLTPSEGERLLALALDHVDFLIDDGNYVGHSNHGLFQDLGLVALSAQLEALDEARTWREASIHRFTTTLAKHVDASDGVYREHSPTYQWVIVNLVRNFRRIARIESGPLVELQAALERAAGWLVLPDGNTPPLGDSDMVPAPPWARRAAEAVDGLRLFPGAGVATVRRGESMLITAAAYHTHAHKHADELGFCLYEHGELLLAEAGKHSYNDAHPGRQYALSSRAHNVLLVDGNDFSFRGTAPYGSALTGAAEHDGWFAIQGTNPLLAQQEATHRRTFIYRPGELLIVVDSLHAPHHHRYTRLLHFGPNVDIHLDGRVARFTAGRVAGLLRDASPQPAQITLRQGDEDHDAPAGRMYPSYGNETAIPTVALDTYATNALLGTVIALGDNVGPVDIETPNGQEIKATVAHRETGSSVTVTSDDRGGLQLTTR